MRRPPGASGGLDSCGNAVHKCDAAVAGDAHVRNDQRDVSILEIPTNREGDVDSVGPHVGSIFAGHIGGREADLPILLSFLGARRTDLLSVPFEVLTVFWEISH